VAQRGDRLRAGVQAEDLARRIAGNRVEQQERRSAAAMRRTV
jgi:hypothetical protein